MRSSDKRWLSQVKAAGLTLSRQLTFMTMTFAGDTAQLAMVISRRRQLPAWRVDHPAGQPAPGRGRGLVAPWLLVLLGLKTGDSLEVVDATLRVVGEVLREPDSGFNPF